jgi:hypothetical protein
MPVGGAVCVSLVRVITERSVDGATQNQNTRPPQVDGEREGVREKD